MVQFLSIIFFFDFFNFCCVFQKFPFFCVILYIASILEWYHQQQSVRNPSLPFPYSNYVYYDGRNVFLY